MKRIEKILLCGTHQQQEYYLVMDYFFIKNSPCAQFDAITTEQCTVKVDWGDGTIEKIDISKGFTHTYDVSNEYEEEISKTITICSNTAIKNIQNSAFYEKYITRIELPASVQHIGTYAFSKTFLTSFQWSANVVEIAEGMFENCSNLEEIEIPEGVEAIGERAFCNCSKLGYYSDVIIPASVKKIGVQSFYSSALRNIHIPDTVAELGGATFEGCSALENAEIDAKITKLSWTFAACSQLLYVKLPDTLIALEECVFHSCTSLSSINIPRAVINIGALCFSACTNLTSIYYEGTTAEWNNINFGSSWHLYCPQTTVYCQDGNIIIPEEY